MNKATAFENAFKMGHFDFCGFHMSSFDRFSCHWTSRMEKNVWIGFDQLLQSNGMSEKLHLKFEYIFWEWSENTTKME